MAPGAVADPQRVVALAERSVAGKPARPDHLITLGAALYRADRAEEAVGRLGEALEAHGKGGVEGWLFLALARQRLGRGAEARQALDRARSALDEAAGSELPWADRLARQFLRAEAEALVQRAKP